jgi:hypothetical protein
VNRRQNTSVKGPGKAGVTYVNSKWPKLILMTGAVSAWLVYDMVTATETPSMVLTLLQYTVLAAALIALIGSVMMFASER